MLLLVTGASAVGKSTVRARLAPTLPADIEVHELGTLVPIPSAPTLAWRQEAVETVVRRAVALQAEARHLLLSGDPVAPGEVLAAPSFDDLDGFAALLLDVQPEAQRQRLAARGEDPALWPNHLGFAAWLRAHHADPQHQPEVLRAGGWDAMRWDRWASWEAGDSRWHFSTLDTSDLHPDAVADQVWRWCREVLGR